ncbi:phosphate signaling complex protein PhoU [Viridibacillus sp. YIM B01967]|uniref:Phosphate-specific transport system accessory protein PhoU n=1 Tax=Viridibacillus soli TaxID=2798301 RepID=A0ABS1H3J4_9BACL|nr:phosphate signaling complex protein PhoU [Viridibacillus soli]MBK3493989.1 phosphate signaling complex protein PhoU [Viridibacillus soli]
MTVREKFENDLHRVQGLMLDLCHMSIHALEKSVEALFEQDIDAALVLMDQDRFINRLEEHINDEVILLIAKQQPVATDLRRLIVMIKAASDMERIGDYAVNIAKETIRLGQTKVVYPTEKIAQMRDQAIAMLKGMVQAFIDEDMQKAKEIALLDDQIDTLYGEAIVEILNTPTENMKDIGQVAQLSFVCRYLERSADHATNLAELLFYLVKGKHYELNQ